MYVLVFILEYFWVQDGATPAVLASKAGHKEVADLIVEGGNAAAAGRPVPRPQESVFFSHDQLQVGFLTSSPVLHVVTEGSMPMQIVCSCCREIAVRKVIQKQRSFCKISCCHIQSMQHPAATIIPCHMDRLMRTRPDAYKSVCPLHLLTTDMAWHCCLPDLAEKVSRHGWQAGTAAPSAPPMPSAPPPPLQGDAPPKSDSEFWGRALNTPIEGGTPRAGGGARVSYPDIYQPSGKTGAYAAHAPFDKSSLATAPVRSRLGSQLWATCGCTREQLNVSLQQIAAKATFVR